MGLVGLVVAAGEWGWCMGLVGLVVAAGRRAKGLVRVRKGLVVRAAGSGW